MSAAAVPLPPALDDFVPGLLTTAFSFSPSEDEDASFKKTCNM